jgi:hypothetical protein
MYVKHRIAKNKKQEPRPKRTIGALWRKEHHHGRAAQEFLRLLRKACPANLFTRSMPV